MAAVAPIIAGAGQVMEGVAANEAAQAQSDIIGQNTQNQVRAEASRLRRAGAAEVAQAGGTGLELTSGSFMNIFEENAVNQAKTLADIKYAGKVAQAQAEQAGKNALIGGIVGGAATAAGGLMKAQQHKQLLAAQEGKVTGSLETVRSKVESGKIGMPEIGNNYLLKKRNLWSLNGPR